MNKRLKFSWKGLIKTVLFSILLFTNILTGFYVLANIIDWKIDFLNINPHESINERNFPFLQYPPSNSSGLQIDSRTTIVFEEMVIRYYGTPAENKPFELSVIGTLDLELAKQISSVTVYFEGAIPYPSEGAMYTGSWGITLFPTIEYGPTAISLGAFLVGEPVLITWQIQGDYFPSITIRYNNFTDITQSYEGYKDYSIHIESGEIIEQQRFNRLTKSIAIAGAFFGFVDGSVIIVSYLRGGREAKNYNQEQPSKPNRTKSKKSKKQGKKRRLKINPTKLKPSWLG